MASLNENDEIPMLPISDSSSRTRAFTSRNRSVSLSNPEPLFLPHPSSTFPSDIFDSTFHDALYDDARGWARRFARRRARRFASSGNRYLPGIMNPHNLVVQSWSKFFALSCLLAIFVDPLFFFLIKVQEQNKCIMIDWPMTRAFVAVRFVTDVIFFMNILLQFRLAYVTPESTVVGAGELVSHPKNIALRYLRGNFFLDLFIAMPLPQILISWIIPEHMGALGANYGKNLLLATVLFQYIPKLYRLLPFVAGLKPTVFISATAWTTIVSVLLPFMLAGHVVGSCWYLFGLQRVNQCLQNACGNLDLGCRYLINCGHRNSDSVQAAWKGNASANACFQEDGFRYGIYLKAVNLTNRSSLFTRYSYSLFWGFQQISTLAGNQVPSYFLGEVFFTMGIIGLGLLIFTLIIGNIQSNMQNFLQALEEKRRLEMMQRQRDVEQWMSQRRLPEGIRMRVREAERFNWATTRGVNEELLFENIPDDLQRDIRRHLFKFLKKVRIFSLMDEPFLDAIHERLKQRTYIRSSTVLHRGGLVEEMVFIVRGEMESIGKDGSVVSLLEGDVSGEELLTWCLEHPFVNPDGTRKGLHSSRDVRCVTNVEAFSLSVADLEDVASLFSRNLRCHRVQGAIRYESPYWRQLAARQIQVAWRDRRRRLERKYTAESSYSR